MLVAVAVVQILEVAHGEGMQPCIGGLTCREGDAIPGIGRVLAHAVGQVDGVACEGGVAGRIRSREFLDAKRIGPTFLIYTIGERPRLQLAAHAQGEAAARRKGVRDREAVVGPVGRQVVLIDAVAVACVDAEGALHVEGLHRPPDITHPAVINVGTKVCTYRLICMTRLEQLQGEADAGHAFLHLGRHEHGYGPMQRVRDRDAAIIFPIGPLASDTEVARHHITGFIGLPQVAKPTVVPVGPLRPARHGGNAYVGRMETCSEIGSIRQRPRGALSKNNAPLCQ